MNPKQHHQVPAFLVARWAGPEERTKGRNAKVKWRRRERPKWILMRAGKVMRRGYAYRVPGSNEEDAGETALMQFEEAVYPVLGWLDEKLDGRGPGAGELTTLGRWEDRKEGILKGFILSMTSRVEAMRQHLEKTAPKERFVERWGEVVEAAGERPIEEWIDDAYQRELAKAQVEIDPNGKAATAARKMEVVVGKIALNGVKFPLTDDPVLRVGVSEDETRFGEDPSWQLVLPIDPRHVLILMVPNEERGRIKLYEISRAKSIEWAKAWSESYTQVVIPEDDDETEAFFAPSRGD